MTARRYPLNLLQRKLGWKVKGREVKVKWELDCLNRQQEAVVVFGLRFV